MGRKDTEEEKEEETSNKSNSYRLLTKGTLSSAAALYNKYK
jgi:hypothetical protein